MVQRLTEKWVDDKEFIGFVVEKGRLMMETYEKRDRSLWLYKVFAIPRQLLRGREDYIQE